MTYDILLTQPVPAPIDAQLLQTYHVHRLYQADDQDALLDAVGPRIHGVVTGGAKGLSNALMDRLPNLRIIAISGIGTDAVDLDRAASRGIRVTTTPGVLTDDVADMAMGLLIMSLRDLAVGDRIVRNGQWGEVNQPLARRVTGTRIGIVGLGQVGHAIARRAQAFGMDIQYNDLREQPQSGYRFFADLPDLARHSDVLVLAASADLGRAIVTAEVLEALGPRGYFINVARGKLVDETALIEALQNGRIAGAGLDVFVDEPRVPEALRRLDNVVLQPHRASATEQTRLAMGEIVLSHLQACFAEPRPQVALPA
ncbi:2-hydroxyacid dehydrogenase [Pseudomonas sp. DTU_2021_1001937_2_SI_NGA_ILE_001]|uniref:2-hydroxyacid dehydrogenase n=1 Tax=Pseudomonas sp. DTU_2021_1001937_2_SI_NGA_ILE_001 TaxID=3077589 RepID=UPI0028FC2FB1|nr:2-hydroxyacid dehydrogenase [Pseudomonas sp. DTU_2021_1001937_2_SI_NGA_ILE_001]WNW13408.1 2-hydroxyacid dehydrogenase [Pseudomonas sp. DTU_2021_1001937_2_SI_NGA_ILE_001]